MFADRKQQFEVKWADFEKRLADAQRSYRFRLAKALGGPGWNGPQIVQVKDKNPISI